MKAPPPIPSGEDYQVLQRYSLSTSIGHVWLPDKLAAALLPLVIHSIQKGMWWCSQNASAAAGLIQDAAQDPAVLAAAQKLVNVVKTSALTTGSWSVQALAADPNVQAAIVPVLEAAAASSPLNWAAVDTTALLARVRGCTLLAALCGAQRTPMMCSQKEAISWLAFAALSPVLAAQDMVCCWRLFDRRVCEAT